MNESEPMTPVTMLSVRTKDEVLVKTVPAIAHVLSGYAAWVKDNTGAVIGHWSEGGAFHIVGEADDPAEDAFTEPEVRAFDEYVELAVPFGTIVVVWSSFYEIFARDDLDIAESIVSVMQLAISRIDLLEEREAETERWRDQSELKDDFIAMVAHDLRSPLSVVSGFTDLLASGNGSLTDAQREEYVEIINRNVHRVSAFIEDVLQVARMQTGQFQFNVQPTDIGDVITGAVEEVAASDDGGHEIDVSLDISNDVEVLADRERLWQVIVNLLSNSCKFSEPNTTVAISARVERPHLYIEIADEGPGIPEDDRERIFEKFSRSHADDGRRVQGTGMGLYICREFMRAQGGDIKLTSADADTGTVFSCRLPTTPSSAGAPETT